MTAPICRMLIVLVTLVLTSQVRGQSLRVSGDVNKPLTLQAADLKAMSHVDVTGNDNAGKEHRYSGVPLVEILAKAGAPVASELKGKNLAKYVVVKAADNYTVVFGLAELDPAFAVQTIILAYSVDGKALPEGTGPFQVIVPNEKKHGRWVRQVTVLEVRTAN